MLKRNGLRKSPLLTRHQSYSFFSSSSAGLGSASEASVEITNTPPTIPNEIGELMWNTGEITILIPMKAKMIARPYFNRRNIWIKFASKKYKARRPRIAKIFDV